HVVAELVGGEPELGLEADGGGGVVGLGLGGCFACHEGISPIQAGNGEEGKTVGLGEEGTWGGGPARKPSLWRRSWRDFLIFGEKNFLLRGELRSISALGYPCSPAHPHRTMHQTMRIDL